MICGVLLLFPTLKEISFTGKSGDKDWDTPKGKAMLDKLMAWVVDFLERGNDQCDGKVVSKRTSNDY